MMNNTKNILLALAMAFAVSNLVACSNARQTLGLDRNTPDEFTVISRAPLNIPPEFDMRPPRPGEKRPQENSIAIAAKKSLLSGSDAYGKKLAYGVDEDITQEKEYSRSNGTTAFLKLAGTDTQIPDIRRTVDNENSVLIKQAEGITDKIIFWQDKEDPTSVLVDPEKEARRIQENQALGKEISEGESPVIERARKGFLEDVF